MIIFQLMLKSVEKIHLWDKFKQLEKKGCFLAWIESMIHLQV